jgi:transcriptional regulator with XRE-family HTH domain
MEREKIKKLLENDRAEGMSVRSICDKIGIPIASFYDYIAMRVNPTKESIAKFISAYNLPTSFFMADTIVKDSAEEYKPKTPTRQMAEQQLDELSEEELKDLVYYLLGRKRPPFTDGHEPPK